MPAHATSEAAPAKINLALHVTGQRADGYHLLDSIVTFASHGDRLSFSPAERDSFNLAGRFGPLLSDTAEGKDGNLVLKARDLLRDALTAQGRTTRPVAIELEKNLPVASGIGGGSADAAATLRGLLRFWQASLSPDRLSEIALKLGADVPMCLESRPLRARGIGEQIDMLDAMPRFALVLANPLQAVSTPDIFRRLTHKDHPPIDAPPEEGDRGEWIGFLADQRNDLEAPARALLPEIAEISDMLRNAGARLVRMSGSGATCFGIYDDRAGADAAEQKLGQLRPDWYFQATETTGNAIG
ncbi:4-(cytidine 5'-diphospho)-2-C-methyl-D-erythritol kinase [Rhizobium sp. KAs_5_22]|uniref:4-(cytidine 5'-diphospho)-2-C-methyl-D-erythritol kinase n=1 Tax=Ciceribacter selenitireducens TaxID=448181 RepID=UPI00048A9176|nr:4-(cytidine 5'-diphospho)-2-C-methyl-D-erythritol kinase [Ciceribacter selenitireducens]PPJ47596.1 4-(cytidine 5'-diphospho)-2-C-methyl-D-erythritol kinase [Rhizobium sp. KAs_5_22]